MYHQDSYAQELVVRGEGEAVDVGVVGVGAAVLGRLGRLAHVPDGQALYACVQRRAWMSIELNVRGGLRATKLERSSTDRPTDRRQTDLVVGDGAEEVRVQAVPGHVLHHVLVRLCSVVSCRCDGERGVLMHTYIHLARHDKRAGCGLAPL